MEVVAKLLTGDSTELAKTLPSNSVHCIVTSPPYFGLRKYLPEDHKDISVEIGGEALHDCGACSRLVLRDELTEDQVLFVYRHSVASGVIPDFLKPFYVPAALCGECYICKMVALFRELKRVLRDDGVCFLNIGDSYNGSGGAGGDYSPGGIRAGQPKYPGRKIPGLKLKDMMLVPQRLALALQADGWIIRNEIIWHKKSPMPEPATDRFVRTHEVVWLLSKQPQYYFDVMAIAERAEGEVRQRRTVLTLGSDNFKGAHFAVMPRELARICILAGTSAAGCCNAKIKKLKVRDDLTVEEETKVTAYLQRKGLI